MQGMHRVRDARLHEVRPLTFAINAQLARNFGEEHHFCERITSTLQTWQTYCKLVSRYMLDPN